MSFKRILSYKKGTIFMIFAIIVILYLAYCYLSVLDVYFALRYSFLTNKGYDNYISRYMTNKLFRHFNNTDILEGYKSVKKRLHLYLFFSINDIFHSGIMWMNYSIIIMDEHNQIITGSLRVPIKIYLRRVGWHWKIVQNVESP